MGSLREALAFHHAAWSATDAGPRFGVVTAVNPANYTARINLMPDNQQTGWLPIKSIWIGNGWGLVCPPNIGDQVTVEPHDNNPDSLVITGRVFSTAQPPPGANAGDFVLVHASGAFIKLTAAGIASNGAWTHTGTITATGDMVAGKGGENISLLGHQHTSETPGAPTSAPI